MKENHVLGILTAYMYWQGDIPVFAYTPLKTEPAAFLAYSSNGTKGEEAFFTSNVDDSRYKYAPLIDVEHVPDFLGEDLEGKSKVQTKPLLTKLIGLNTMTRTLLFLSLDEPVFPLWHFKRKDKNILGTIIPFEHYYESDALPVFFYVATVSQECGGFGLQGGVGEDGDVALPIHVGCQYA